MAPGALHWECVVRPAKPRIEFAKRTPKPREIHRIAPVAILFSHRSDPERSRASQRQRFVVGRWEVPPRQKSS